LRKALVADEQEAIVLRLGDAEPEEHIGLVVHHGIARRRHAERVAEDAIGPLGRVGARVEEGPIVVRPLNAEVHILDLIGEHRPPRDVLHHEREVLRAARVDEEREQPVIRAHLRTPEAEVSLPRRHHVLVEQDFFGRLERALLSRVNLILLPFLRARVVVERIAAHRDGEVGLLDAAEHLLVQLLLERLEVLRHLVGVGVLCLQILDDIGILAIAQPEVVVDEDVAVNRVDFGDRLRERRCRRLGDGGGEWGQ
jgi:hypothetical protein